MSITRQFTKTEIGRNKAMDAAIAKYNSGAPADSAISPVTMARLISNSTTYRGATSAVESAEETQRTAYSLAKTNRKLLRTNVGCFFKTLNIGIELEVIPETARAFFGLAISNDKLPVINTDAKLLFWANEIFTGDAKRVAAGGIAITMPAVADITLIATSTKAAITGLSAAKTVLSAARTVVKNMNEATDNIILHAWNEIETTFSELPASTMRTNSREWGVLYVSVGNTAVITGKCTDIKTGLPLSGVSVHIEGVATKVLTDVAGNFSLNTSLYGDLVLIAALKDYAENDTSITMENGVNMVVNISMTAL